MKNCPGSSKPTFFTAPASERLMLRCAGAYIVTSAAAAALGFTGIGHLSLAAVVFVLLFAALLLSAGMLCSAFGMLCAQEPPH